jgi:hypothetical protein
MMTDCEETNIIVFPLWSTVFLEKIFSLSNQETSTTKVAIHTNLFTDLYSFIRTGNFEIG